ncbi:hypothetical protein EMPS_02396 [Entomortierella parvispora]|uniref:Peptidase S8/S53 domain-containing protein n=1 Tax=Entomortierella parvispora TaxID=205924 RepID=A0A9P3H4T2_9FUNG|nr:hypothetical protein EMPS_02396 [Entomortierella parvispora]
MQSFGITMKRNRPLVRTPVVLFFVLLAINVPPWLMYKGNRIGAVCALEVTAPESPPSNFQPIVGDSPLDDFASRSGQSAFSVEQLDLEADKEDRAQEVVAADEAVEDKGSISVKGSPMDPSPQARIITGDLKDNNKENIPQDQEHEVDQQEAPSPKSTPAVEDAPLPTTEAAPSAIPPPPLSPKIDEHEKAPGDADTTKIGKPSRHVQTNTYYARLSAPPGTADAREQHRVVTQALLALPDGRVTIRHEFGMDEDDVLNVISFKLEGSGDGLEEIAAMNGVIGIYPVRTRKRPRALPLGSLQLTRPTLESAHILTGIQMAREKLGLTGKGIKVGIIDTGIDYTHPALGGCFGPGCKVAFGYDFVGDDYDNGDTDKDTPRPDKDPMDCAGHGTHVAGIVAARNIAPNALGTQGFVGVAPDATLGAYRVFGCEGEVGDDVLLAAIKRAFGDGMDVVNLSLGGSSGWPEEPFATACAAYIRKGLHISIANGNDGEEGLFEDGAPATAAGAIAVGSVDNTYFLGPAADLSYKAVDARKIVDNAVTSGRQSPGKIGMAMASDAADVSMKSFRKDAPYVVHVSAQDPVGCTAYDTTALEKEYKISRANILVLIRRGICTFTEKAKFISNAKLGGMLVYDIIPEQRPLGMAINGLNISAAGLSLEDANTILDALKAKPQGLQLTAQFSTEDQVLKLASGGKISDFSSWGPDARLSYKPDIVTPGGMIYSTFPVAKGGFMTLQGTSMSSPYMAGIQAIYLARYGKTEPAKLLNLLQSTAVPTVRPGSTTGLTSVFQQGGGLVSMERLFAADPPTFVIPTALYLNDTQFQKLEHELSFTNPSSTGTRAWTLVHRPAFSINGFEESNHYTPVNQSRLRSSELGAGAVTMTPSQFSLGPGATGKVQIRVEPPPGLNVDERWLYSGFIEFLCKSTNSVGEVSDCGSSLVSYGGMHGNLAGVPILNPALAYPALQLDRLTASTGPKTQSVTKGTEDDENDPEQRSARHRRQPEQQLNGEEKVNGHHHHRVAQDHGLQKDEDVTRKNTQGKKGSKEDADKDKKKNLFRDRKESVRVGKGDDDWVQILVSVNFPTGLLTIEAESVCDDDRGGQADNTIRLEIGGSGQGRFQIETAAALEEAERVVAVSHQRMEQHQQGDNSCELDEEDDAILNDPIAVAMMEERLNRSQELAFMPSGLYMPYEGYSQVMLLEPSLYEDELLEMKAKEPKDNKDKKYHSNSKSKSTETKKTKKTKKSKSSKNKAKKGRRLAIKGRSKSVNAPKGASGHRGRKEPPPGRPVIPPNGSGRTGPACLPRILGLIPNGFNPWSSRSDSTEGNTFQIFTWQGDLLLENKDIMNGAAGADVPQALLAKKKKLLRKKIKKMKRGVQGMDPDKKDEKRGGGRGHGGHKAHRKKKPNTSEEEQKAPTSRDLPDGRYRLVVKVLKPWGVRGRASDVERWSSPIIIIKRNRKR